MITLLLETSLNLLETSWRIMKLRTQMRSVIMWIRYYQSFFGILWQSSIGIVSVFVWILQFPMKTTVITIENCRIGRCHAKLKYIWCCYKANSFTSKSLQPIWSEIGLFTLHIWCVLCSFLFQSFLVFTVIHKYKKCKQMEKRRAKKTHKK